MGTDAQRDEAKRRRDLNEALKMLQSSSSVRPSAGETHDEPFPKLGPPQKESTGDQNSVDSEKPDVATPSKSAAKTTDTVADLYQQPLIVDPFINDGLAQVQKKLHSLGPQSPRAQMAEAIQQQTTSKAPPHAAYRGSEVADAMLRERNQGSSVTPTDESRAYAREGVAYVPSELLNYPEAMRPTIAAMGSQTIANHELEHATKQPSKKAPDQLGDEQSPDQTAREIGPSMGDLAFRAEQFKREEGKPLDVQIELPGGIKHDAQWMADQAKQHGYFEGRSMHELLFNTDAGRQYMKQMASREAAMSQVTSYQPSSTQTEPTAPEPPSTSPTASIPESEILPLSSSQSTPPLATDEPLPRDVGSPRSFTTPTPAPPPPTAEPIEQNVTDAVSTPAPRRPNPTESTNEPTPTLTLPSDSSLSRPTAISDVATLSASPDQPAISPASTNVLVDAADFSFPTPSSKAEVQRQPQEISLPAPASLAIPEAITPSSTPPDRPLSATGISAETPSISAPNAAGSDAESMPFNQASQIAASFAPETSTPAPVPAPPSQDPAVPTAPPSVSIAPTPADDTALADPATSVDIQLSSFDQPSGYQEQPVALPPIDTSVAPINVPSINSSELANPITKTDAASLEPASPARLAKPMDGSDPADFDPSPANPVTVPDNAPPIPATPSQSPAEDRPLPPPANSVASQADWGALNSLPSANRSVSQDGRTSARGEMEQTMIAAESLAEESTQMMSRLAMLLQSITAAIGIHSEQIEALQIRLEGGVIDDR